MSRAAATKESGRCLYCLSITGSPAKPVYELGTGGAHARFPHHRRRALLPDGTEVLPLCQL